METNILRDFKEIASIKQDWEMLEEIAPQVSYFSSYRYVSGWWTTYRDDATIEPYVIVVYHNMKIVGIAPLQIKTYKSRLSEYKELQFAHGGGDHANFIVNHNESAEPAKIVSEMIKAIIDNKTDYDRIAMTHIDYQSLLAHQLLISHQNASLTYLVECPFIDFTKYGSYDEFTKLFLPKKIRQYINRFGREVDYSMKVTDENLVEEFGKVHIAEKDYLKEKGFSYRHSFFENERELGFRKALYNDNKNVLTYMLVDNATNDIICYYTGYVFRNKFHSVTTAYHPKYANLAVGKIFNYMIFEENFKNPRWEIFDMGTGRYAWKFEMTSDFTLLYQLKLNVFRSSKAWFFYRWRNLLSGIHHLVRDYKRDER